MLRRIITIFLYAVCLAKPIAAKDLIDETQNCLTFPAGHELFDSLYSHIRNVQSTSTGRINVLHIGGSHVQAGHFSHRLRYHFTDLVGDGAKGQYGVLFPWKAIRTNAPVNYDISYTGKWTRSRNIESSPDVELGLSGAAAITSDSMASLALQLKERTDVWAFSRLRLIGECGYEKVEPVLILSQGDTLRAESSNNGYLFELPYPATHCSIAFLGLETPGAKFVVRGILPENDNAGIVYNESGVNGASVPSWLRCSLFQQEIRTFCPPDLVIFGIGINDANVPANRFDVERYKQNYRDLITRLQSVNPNVALLFVTNNDCFLRYGKQKGIYNRNTKTVEQAMMELAREFNGAVWNQFRIMGGFGSSSNWVSQKMMRKDHIHFTEAGYHLLADKLYEAFKSDFGD